MFFLTWNDVNWTSSRVWGCRGCIWTWWAIEAPALFCHVLIVVHQGSRTGISGGCLLKDLIYHQIRCYGCGGQGTWRSRRRHACCTWICPRWGLVKWCCRGHDVFARGLLKRRSLITVERRSLAGWSRRWGENPRCKAWRGR